MPLPDFSYGATGTAMGWASWILNRAAGVVQIGVDFAKKGTFFENGNPLSMPYGDQLRDQHNIWLGVFYVDNGCSR
jgi:putative RNase toxin 44 of polymorphic toxin system